jgi:DNA-binding NarL/FixJ family response regulator
MAGILIVDDQPLVRKMTRALLVEYSMPVCGEAEDGKQAVEKVGELRPDLVILDVNMPVLNGFKAAEEIHRIAPSTKIAFFTVADAPYARYALTVGPALGDAFVSKSDAETELIPTLKRLLAV